MNKSFAIVLALVALSVVLFALSLPAPAFYDGEVDARHATQGWTCLSLGWFAAIFGLLGPLGGNLDFIGTVSWFVNPMLLAVWVCASRGRRGAALKVAVPALLLSLCFLGVDTIPVPDNQTQSHIAPATAYTLWVLSTVVAVIAALLVKPRGDGGAQRPAAPRSR